MPDHVRATTALARWVMRPTGIAQVVLGVLFWTGHALALIPLHMLVGMLFVLSLWGLAGFGARTPTHRRLSILPALWGALVLGLGIAQGRLLPGSMHWVVKTLHLLVGLAAMALANHVVRRVRVAPPESETVRAPGAA